MFHCLVIKVLLCFLLSCDSFFTLSHLFFFVKHFFQVFFKVFRTLPDFRTVLLICDCRLCSSDLITLTCCLLFVKNFFLISFFKLLQHLFFSTAFRVYHNSFALSRTFLLSFLKKERRRRDLNPRAAINDLLPFQGSPFGQLGYFSKLP